MVTGLGFMGGSTHIAMTSETRGFSRVAAGFSSYEGDFWLPLVLAQHILLSLAWGILSIALLACEMSTIVW